MFNIDLNEFDRSLLEPVGKHNHDRTLKNLMPTSIVAVNYIALHNYKRNYE